jgi:hypothetical protein
MRSEIQCLTPRPMFCAGARYYNPRCQCVYLENGCRPPENGAVWMEIPPLIKWRPVFPFANLSPIVKYSSTSTFVALLLEFGRVIAQAVSRWLPTAAARVRFQVRSYGICGGQSGTGAGFLRALRFPLPIPHSTDCSIIIIIDHTGLVQ